MSEGLALFALAACLMSSIARWPWAPEWGVAPLAVAVLLASGVLTPEAMGKGLSALAPTVGFLACLLVLADGCRRAGLFDALGEEIATAARGRPGSFFSMVVLAASLTTVILSLDATVVLFTPIVLTTASRLRTDPRPSLYACSHLANSASLLLPISNLTNLIAFQDSRLAFLHFAALMAVPWLLAIAVEWFGLRRAVAPASAAGPDRSPAGSGPGLPRFALAVIALTLVGFAASSEIGVAPVWVAAAAALVMTVHVSSAPGDVIRAGSPGFLIFVLGLGVVVRAASDHGLSGAITALLPHGVTLGALLAVAGVAAVAANLVNNLPATLIILPVAASSGAGAVLAMLIGVNVGPNLTYVGSLATLLWRRVLHSSGVEVDLRRFTLLGLLTVPPILAASTAALWLGLQVIGA